MVQRMMEKLKSYWQGNPLPVVLILAAAVRLLAAVFSEGYAMSDDYFVVIGIAQQWIDGYPNWFNLGHPSGFSIVYPGLHYLLFYLLNVIGVVDPEIKMLIVRLLHAGYSLITVYFGYLITLKLSDLKTARLTGLLLGLFWIMPFMSVRNLIEMACIPPMMIGYYLILRAREQQSIKIWIYAGILFGIAFAFRYQSILIPGGIGLVLLAQKQWRTSIGFAGGVATGLFFLQGLVDWIAWGYPFAAFLHYTVSNIESRYDYITGEWYRYLLLLLGIFIPPVSFYLLYGAVRMWKKLAVFFWPMLLFLAFHSVYPNKQERFILPMLPMLIITGIAGWQDFVRGSEFWQRHGKFLKGTWVWFWIINTILLTVLTLTYTKRSLVEPMNYFREKKDLTGFIIEYNHDGMPWFPRFYLGREVPIHRLTTDKSDSAFVAELAGTGRDYPNYVFFFGNDDLDARVARVENLLGVTLVHDKTVEPSLMDDILHTLNPRHNRNLTSHIYRIKGKGCDLEENP